MSNSFLSAAVLLFNLNKVEVCFSEIQICGKVEEWKICYA
jgi:hypothetical protein